MKTVLILSSQVASSKVGASASAFCFGRLGLRTIVLPTTLFGRHPGWGTPGGGPVDVTWLRDMWRAIRNQRLTIDGVMSGYLGDQSHIDLAIDIIGEVRADNPDATVLVDPVMGDAPAPGKDGTLYIPEARAERIMADLVPLADILTPNLWELGYQTGLDVHNAESTYNAAKALPCPSVLVTSVPLTRRESGEDGLGALYTDPNTTLTCRHTLFNSVPHGGGDSLAAMFLGRLLKNNDPRDAFSLSVSSTFAILKAAVRRGDGELPLEICQDLIMTPPLLETQTHTYGP